MINNSEVDTAKVLEEDVNASNTVMQYFIVFAVIFLIQLALTLSNNAHALTANTVTKSCQFDNVVGVTADQPDPDTTNNEDLLGNAGDACTAMTVGDVTIAEDGGSASVPVSIANASSVDTVVSITTTDNSAEDP
ncbi:hypothetical protein, partial [uncultured Cocleimonas sp.]|uniref:hypothetical protein n=1 Tax=uncultured Cocleimonas sp. TaxID=1051587 RepID=UPI002602ED0E